jgi:diacylglycerol kinase family enzyme
MERTLKRKLGMGREWTVTVDGQERARGRYQALIVVNGDLGKNLPFARGVPLGSGDFHLFSLRDLGAMKLPGQFRKAFDASIEREPERWGFEGFRVEGSLVLAPVKGGAFPVNRDGSTMACRNSARFTLVDQVKLMARARE